MTCGQAWKCHSSNNAAVLNTFGIIILYVTHRSNTVLYCVSQHAISSHYLGISEIREQESPIRNWHCACKNIHIWEKKKKHIEILFQHAYLHSWYQWGSQDRGRAAAARGHPAWLHWGAQRVHLKHFELWTYFTVSTQVWTRDCNTKSVYE